MTPAGPRSGRLSVLRDPRFARFFAGQAISTLGDQFTAVALAIAMITDGGSPARLSAVLTARAVPLAALLLLGGV